MDPVSKLKTGGWCVFEDQLLTECGYDVARLEAGGNPIALCEGAMIPLTFLWCESLLNQRDIIWFTDNSAALHCFIKGCSTLAGLDRSVAIFSCLTFRAKSQVWFEFEFVDSESNWADRVSRLLGSCPWARDHGFQVRQYHINPSLWQGTPEDMWHVLVSQPFQ